MQLSAELGCFAVDVVQITVSGISWGGWVHAVV